jgi:ABC-2 type transport system permease protein
MTELYLLFRLRWLRWKGQLRHGNRRHLLQSLVLGTATLVFLAFETYVFYRVFKLFLQNASPTLQPILHSFTIRLLDLGLLIFGVMLFYSNLITSVSVFLTARDMPSLLVWPIRPVPLYISRLVETLVRSSLAITLFLLPLLMTYGYLLAAPAQYYLAVVVLVLLFLMIPGAVAVPVLLLLARLFPVRTIYRLLLAIGLAGATLSLFVLRLLRFEELFRHQVQLQNILTWREELPKLDHPWSPVTLLMNLLNKILVGESFVGDELLRFLGLVLLVCIISIGVGSCLIRSTWERTISTPVVTKRKTHPHSIWYQKLLSWGGADGALVQKEIRMFLRDASHWSQLLMMVPLVGFYALNLYFLPYRDQFSGLYYLMNQLLVEFIILAICTRYLFPAISWEGPPLWIIRKSPYSLNRLVIIKFLFLSAPLMLLTVLLVVCSFQSLHLPNDSLGSALVLSLCTTLLLGGLATGLGAMFPQFQYEHHLEISLGPSGIITMLGMLGFLCLYLLVLIQPILENLQGHSMSMLLVELSRVHSPSPSLCIGWGFLCTGIGVGVVLLGGRVLSRRDLQM